MGSAHSMPGTPGWEYPASDIAVVIPVKQLSAAKTRLASYLSATQRRQLVLAMLSDTIHSALLLPRVNSVTVVTPDEKVKEHAHSLGVLVLDDPQPEVTTEQLNAAISYTTHSIRKRMPITKIIVLQADLPALKSHELADAIESAQKLPISFVADHHGTGTAAYFDFDPNSPMNTQFGPESARLHREAGAVELFGEWPGLRCDVDLASDLNRARELGCGHHTDTWFTSSQQIPTLKVHP
ncbi:MAG: 2-phospho-L-lactate guanylyltransferase [Mycobacteriaceae bacterium]